MYEWWLAQAIDQALQGGDIAQALDQAQRKAVVYTDCLWSGNDNAVCVQQADPSW
jgi:hypothetical protein